MRSWISAVGLAAAVLGGSAVQAGAATHCRLIELGELPVTSDGANLTVDAQINGRAVKMIVDTGSLATVLFRGPAEKLRLAPPAQAGQPGGAGANDQSAVVRVRAFQVGDTTANNVGMVVTAGAGGGAQGKLGALFLLRDDVEFDLPDGKIRLFKPGSCEGDQVVYWGQAYSVTPMLGGAGHMIEVKVLLNGGPVVARLDTGAAGSGVTTSAAARAGVTANSQGASSGSQLQCMGPVGVRSFVGDFPSLTFGDETIRNAQLQVADLFDAGAAPAAAPGAAADEPQMLLGADFFRSHRIYVSAAQRKVYVSYMGGPVFQADLGACARSASR